MSKCYQYILNEYAVDGKGKIIPSMQMEGFNLDQKKWLSYHSRVFELEKYIRTKKNPKGMIDYREFRTDDEKVIYDSKSAFDEIPEKIYSFEDLSLMEKRDIIGICRMYNISMIGKTTKKLIKDILDMQTSILIKSDPVTD